MRPLLASACVAALLLAGCAGQPAPLAPQVKRADKDSPKGEKDAPRREDVRRDAEAGVADKAAHDVLAGGARQPEPAAAERPKVIYTGQVDLVVEEFEGAADALLALVKERGGYIARHELDGSAGFPRTGTWTVRVPANRFEAFMDGARRLGELQRSRIDSEDISDRYHDTRAEIKNLEAREESLRGLYKEKVAGSRLPDLLEVDRELTSVRGQINVRKGQVQRWDKELEYSSAVVQMHERRGYVPPVPPTFRGTVGRTFFGSVDALLALGKALVLTVVAVAPWLPVLALIGVPAALLARRARRVQAQAFERERAEREARAQARQAEGRAEAPAGPITVEPFGDEGRTP